MKHLILVVAVVLLTAGIAVAAAPKTYQVTGPVLALTDDTITLQKGTEKWEIVRGSETKVTGDLKIGSRVTIQYQMKAVTVEVKEEAKKGEKAEPKKSAEPKKK
jgi:hypothetical protein